MILIPKCSGQEKSLVQEVANERLKAAGDIFAGFLPAMGFDRFLYIREVN